MTKINKLLSIDYELNEKLKGIGNASALVSRLLESHFNAHLSDDIDFLTKKVGELDIQIKTSEVNRDAMAERIRVISEKTKNHEEEEEAKSSLDNKRNDLNRWLEQKCKAKEITFQQYRDIKHFENFEGDLQLEYSPESFTQTELDFTVKICEAVMDEWEGFSKEKIILKCFRTYLKLIGLTMLKKMQKKIKRYWLQI